jgi:hypothetical protein
MTIVRRGPITSGYQPLDFYQGPILLSISILLFYFLRGRTEVIHVSVSIMQLSSIEPLYVSAQALHKVRLESEHLENVMHSVLALLKGQRASLNEAWRVLSPISSLINSGIRTYTQWHA